VTRTPSAEATARFLDARREWRGSPPPQSFSDWQKEQQAKGTDDMGFTATAKSEYRPAPDGTHAATCTQLIDLGHQVDEWQGRERVTHKILIGWELDTEEKRDDGSPFVVWGRYTLSLGAKSRLRPMLESWRGRPFSEEELESFDVAKLLGAPCMLSVVHVKRDGNVYANVSSVASLPKKMPKPTPIGKMVRFDLSEPDMAVFDTFSDRLKDTIKSSREWIERHGEPAKEPEFEPPTDDTIPF
jgi:hypothetical protein